MRVALLSYRSKEHCGGQGVYVRHLSRALADLGHEVDVLSGQPYPARLDPRVRLVEVPSLDLYREPDPFRTPRLAEFRSVADVVEYATMLTGCFAEPLGFSLRAARLLRADPSRYDVVHDNQSLGYGLLALARRGIPLVATLHHPISRDRAVDLAEAPTRRRRVALRRWYAFVAMQAQVARRLPVVLGVSDVAAADATADFALAPGQIRVVPLGVDTALFAPAGSGWWGGWSRSRVPTGRSRAWSTCWRPWPSCAPSDRSSCSWSPGSSPAAPPAAGSPSSAWTTP